MAMMLTKTVRILLVLAFQWGEEVSNICFTGQHQQGVTSTVASAAMDELGFAVARAISRLGEVSRLCTLSRCFGISV